MTKEKSKARGVAAVVVVLIILALAGFAGYKIFRVNQINVLGNQLFTDEYIISRSGVSTDTHMLMVDEETAKAGIESDPYLMLVDISYEMPDTVNLTVSERTAAAWIDYAGSPALLDKDLVVLEMNDTGDTSPYPQITGIAVESITTGVLLGADDEYKLTVAASLLAALPQSGVGGVSVIDVSDANNVVLHLTEGYEIYLGQADNFANKLAWVARVLPILKSEGKTGGIIDVSSGEFATYRAGAQAPAASVQPTATGDPDTAASPQPDAGQEPEPNATNSAEPGASPDANATGEPSPEASAEV